MATADISKQSVFDARIVQNPPRYAVQKGALSLTNAPYNAISATTSQHTYQINVPSQNVFVDRALQWSSEVLTSFKVTVAGLSAAVNVNNANVPVFQFGVDGALCAFPLNSLVGTTTATINDASITINTESVFSELLRLTDYKKNRISRTCPTRLDTVADYVSLGAAVNSPLSGYADQTDVANAPNGAYGEIVFTTPAGIPLSGAGNYADAGAPGLVVNFADGLPRLSGTADPNGVYTLYIKWRSTEKLLLSPFIFADAAEWETGIFGVNNIQIVLNMRASIGRLIRSIPRQNVAAQSTTNPSRTVTEVAYNSPSPFSNAKINVQYLTPSLDLPLPAKSVVQYMEFPRYLQTYTGQSLLPGATSTFSSQTIVLPQIPDMLIIYMKPDQNSLTSAKGDYYLPITQISINFDNFAGLLSSHTKEQLYEMAVHNGLEMDYNQWSGLAARRAGPGATSAVAAVAPRVQTTGGFLVLRPGVDFALQSGQAAGLIGNFTLQYNFSAFNPGVGAEANPVLTTIAVNSGFFETLAGSSRIVKGVLSEADIISAEPAPEVTHEGVDRMIGHGFMDKLGSFLTKAKEVYTNTKPAVSAFKGALPEGAVRSALGAVGYGRHGSMGAGMSGGDAAGAGAGRAGGAKKTLSARLM